MTDGKLLLDRTTRLHELPCDLYNKGEEGHSIPYNVLSAEALRLSMCINELQAVLLKEKTND